MHPVIQEVTDRLIERSRPSRAAYLARLRAEAEAARLRGPARSSLGCANLAHGFAAASETDKIDLRGTVKPGVAIVSSYNDMLSAHQPYETYPAILKAAVRKAGGVAQFAGGVPAMCDGITQGRAGMELSLYSREVIAMATAIALSHDMFDASLMLGVCDKIVPGLLIGALHFGHLPAVFVPAGPMGSGLPNKVKARTRQLFAEGKVGKDELLDAEAKSYHSPGTCTFYGTANSNQVMIEVMGLHLPGATFVNPRTELREALTRAAGRRAVELTVHGEEYTPVGEVVDEKAIVNACVALLATGGSTNHTMHIVAIAAAAGIELLWDDLAALSDAVPLLTRMYPNGQADVNHFQAAGGMQVLIGELLDAGLLHGDVLTVAGRGLDHYRSAATLKDGELIWEERTEGSGDPDVLRPVSDPFSADGGIHMLDGNLGRAVSKVSAVKQEHLVIEAPAKVFDDQLELLRAFETGELDGQDFVAVIRYQGPSANGMPELHKLTPPMAVLLDRGQRVAIVTDGRMSGASGKVPAAIHLSPEAADGGPIALVRDGDPIRLDAAAGTLELLVPAEELAARTPQGAPLTDAQWVGTGRELFGAFRRAAGPAERGASVFALNGRAESLAAAAGQGRTAAPGHSPAGSAGGSR
ncbi:phosphogluconate dehydratase [Streptosporangium becharense]|uniref:Phosphogluconate dehydratase n=1 Tax=Streptosporangium becharense TaxID=1816182 RepID=A0A7W9ILG9_9ACTN|nr:phosphogluconate dehydratase [Streptosporangium becharense]MBB2910187.1 phosphogluconate dehydratase [Streptosporangium becharense]MBB5822930.1 phosphogluconate dehydratase [Streptosporangium becharense]